VRVRILLLAVSLGLLGFAPAPLPRKDRARTDPNDVTGQWVFETCETNGIDEPQAAKEYRIEITREKLVFHHQRGKTEYDLRLYPDVSPRAFTWSRGGSTFYVGSYRLTGGRLTMIFTGGSRLEDRPTNFDGKPPWRYVYRRVGR